MKFKAYPLIFKPIFKERIWGGTKLKDVLNKSISSELTGESWEISSIKGDVSVINNGELKDKSLNEVINSFPNEILGTEVYKKFDKEFPLLFKYLDAREDLSIQVHPNDQLAMKRHNSFGKTEMWYVIQADNEARIIVGFNEESSREEYLENLKKNTLLSILDKIEVKEGEVFFLETGTVHAIGAGMIIAEIQQTSDITYRLYDFDRVNASGNKRELHIDLALDAINYHKVNSYREYKRTRNESNSVVNCPYFTTNFIPLEGEIKVSKKSDSFTVYMCTDGDFEIDYDGLNYLYKKGDTILIPAVMTDYVLRGKASLLEIFI
jgi:mannose-6-phosphate isomerase